DPLCSNLLSFSLFLLRTFHPLIFLPPPKTTFFPSIPHNLLLPCCVSVACCRLFFSYLFSPPTINTSKISSARSASRLVASAARPAARTQFPSLTSKRAMSGKEILPHPVRSHRSPPETCLERPDGFRQKTPNGPNQLANHASIDGLGRKEAGIFQ